MYKLNDFVFTIGETTIFNEGQNRHASGQSLFQNWQIRLSLSLYLPPPPHPSPSLPPSFSTQPTNATDI